MPSHTAAERAKESIRIAKPGDPDPREEFVTVAGQRRPVKKESFIALVRGALRSLSPNIRDRRERIEAALDEADKGKQ